MVAGISDRITQNIIENLTHSQRNLEVIVNNNIDPELIEQAAVHEHADIVIFELKESDLPVICNDLLNRLPDSVLIGLVSNGQRVVQYALYNENMDTEEFINSIIVSKKRFLKSCN